MAADGGRSKVWQSAVKDTDDHFVEQLQMMQCLINQHPINCATSCWCKGFSRGLMVGSELP